MSVQEHPSDLRTEVAKVLGTGNQHTLSFRLSRFIVFAIFVVVIAFGGYKVFLSSDSSSGDRYITEQVKAGDLVVIVSATGTVQPINKVDVSSELSGIIRRVYVDYNSIVKKGEPLAELDTDKLQILVNSSKAKLIAARAKTQDAKATLLEKKLELDRKKALARKEITTTYNLEVAKAAYDRAVAAVMSADADVQVAAAELKLNQTNLTKAIITSPINGVVLERSAEPGQTVAASLSAPVLFTLAEDLKQMEIEVAVDEADVGKVKEGQNATFRVDAYPERSFSARIRTLHFGSETTQGVVTYKAVLTTGNEDLSLRPGMTATAEIRVLSIRKAITVPNSALRYIPPQNVSDDNRSFLEKLMPGPPPRRKANKVVQSGSKRKIWILRNGNAQEVLVVIGASDGKRTQILEGDIEPGQPVIIDNAATTK